MEQPDTNVQDTPDQDATTSPGLSFDLADGGRRSTPTGFVLDAVRRRESGRQAMSVLTTILFIAGASLFSWPVLTDVYTNEIVQERLTEEFALFDTSVETFDDYEAAVSGKDGVALTKIVIPDIGIETLVVEGTTPSALRAGAGHYSETPLPGQVGNVAIAGHRTTYGRPFNRLDELDVGDTIWLVTPVGDHEYRIVGEPASPECKPTASSQRPDAAACITNPGDWSVVTTPEGTDTSLLTLTTCHPKGSAAQRLIVRAELVESYDKGTVDGQTA
jgi:sortase A